VGPPVTAPIDVAATVERIAAVLQECGIRHAFGGAIAQNYWGTVRATQDVDLLALVPALKTPELVDALMRSGFRVRDAGGQVRPITVKEAREAWLQDHLLTLWLDMTKVEIFSPVIPLQERILERAVPMPFRGRSIPITTAEDLVLLKMVFHREKDLRDVRGILVACKDRLDAQYMLEQAQAVLDDARRAELQQLLGKLTR
jgi:hypothetical protein